MSEKSRVERVILTSCVSTSGKYRLMLAEHIRSGSFCYDVIVLNTKTNELITRHYGKKEYSDEANKAEALRIYDDLRAKLTAPARKGEADEPKRETRLILPN